MIKTDDDKEEELVDEQGQKVPEGSKEIAMAIMNELANGMVESPIEVEKEVQKDDEKTNNENFKLLDNAKRLHELEENYLKLKEELR